MVGGAEVTLAAVIDLGRGLAHRPRHGLVECVVGVTVGATRVGAQEGVSGVPEAVEGDLPHLALQRHSAAHEGGAGGVSDLGALGELAGHLGRHQDDDPLGQGEHARDGDTAGEGEARDMRVCCEFSQYFI